MIKFIAFLILFGSCTGSTTSEMPSKTDSVLTTNAEPSIQYDQLKQYLLTSDSVVLLSHHSPNMPIEDPKTGEYDRESIPFINNGKINYATSVQERKQLIQKDIKVLVEILSRPAVDDGIRTMCFQPRNAVVAFKGNEMSCFDFCFDCSGFSRYGDFRSALIMDSEKYQALFDFFREHGLKYEME